MKYSTLFALSFLGLCSQAFASSNGKIDRLDPIYEEGILPNNYYVQEKTKDTMIFANDRVPNMNLTVKFVRNNDRPMYEFIADYMFKVEHEAISVDKCQNSPFYKNFSSIEFECVKNQDSFIQVIFTQFEDQNNQPSDFFRITTVSYKTGDGPSSEDIGEMINYANYNLGNAEYFSKMNIPQKTVLNHHTDPDFNNIDISQMEELGKESENLWFRPLGSLPVTVEGTEITDKGMKFFLKTNDTNEKFVATMFLSEESRNEHVVKQLSNAIPDFYHNCVDWQEISKVEATSIKAKCDEGNILLNVRQLYLRKMEYFVYEVISGNEDLLNRIFADPLLSKRMSTYLYKTFYDREILHKKNNVIEYIQQVVVGNKKSAPISYVIDNSTEKSIALGPSTPQKSKPTEDSVKKSFITENAQGGDGSQLYSIIAGAAGVCALVVLLVFFIKRRKQDEEARAEKERIRAEKARIKAEENAKKGSEAGEKELLAELAAAQLEREKQQRKLYKQQRDAEELAKKLEEDLKKGGEEEINRRKAALDKFSSGVDPISKVAAAITQLKVEASDSEANRQARDQIKNNISETLNAPAKPQTADAEKKSEAKDSGKDQKAEEDKTSQTKDSQTKSASKGKKIWTNSTSDSVITEEEKELKEKERLAEMEAEKKRKEQEIKLKGESLLMKMKKDRGTPPTAEEQPKTPVPEAPKSQNSKKFSLEGDKKDKVQEDPSASNGNSSLPKGSIFGEDDMVAPASEADKDAGIMLAKAPAEAAPEKEVSEVIGKPETITQPVKNSIFSDDELVQSVAIEPKIKQEEKTAPEAEPNPVAKETVTAESSESKKKRVKNPFDALVVDKRQETAKRPVKQEEEAEPEIDLEGQLNEEIDLNFFENNKDDPSSFSNEKVLDIPQSDETVLDLSSEVGQDFDNGFGTNVFESGNSERKNFFGSSEEVVAPAPVSSGEEAPAETVKEVTPAPEQAETEPAKESQSRRKSTKKIRKFNLKSISVSISDNEN